MDPKLETLKVSILFFILFTATNSSITIITFIYEQANLPALAPTNIAVSYLAFILSTIYAPSCKWKIKHQMLLGTAMYTLNYSTGLIIPHVSTPFKFMAGAFGAAGAGLSAGLLWVSQGRYIHLACEKAAVPERKGELFGLFSLLYCLSHISAGLITTFGLGLFSPQVYFICITATGLISVAFCALVIGHIQDQPTLPKLQEQEQPQEEAQQESLAQTFRYYPKMRSILCLLIIDGVCYGFHISEITHMIPSNTPADKLNLYAGYCNVALGCGASLGGWVSGWLGDRLGSRRSGNLGITMFLLGTILAFSAIKIQLIALTLASSFFWGLFLFYIEGWLYMVCSREFKGRSQSFSVNKQLGSITCFLFQLIVIFTKNDIRLDVSIPVIAALAFPAWWSLRKLPLHRHSKSLLEKGRQEQPSLQESLTVQQ